MQILTLPQGSPEWHQHRATALNASDAPAMLGISPYRSRTDLVRERATGIAPDVTPAQQRIFDRGHRIEALARPQAEAVIGEDLSPCVGTSGKFSASFDGITFTGDTAWECKTLNASLREAMPYAVCDDSYGARLPEHYRAQMEHQAMVSGCERILFTAASLSDEGGTLDDVRHCWYTPDPELRARLLAGWEQFERDVAAYVPAEAAATVVAAPQESLPAVVVQVQGALTVGGNLPAFAQALRGFIERIPAKPATDQEFADAEAACKALKKAEDALTQAEDGALAQISDVEIMRRTVADLRELARTTRLRVEKLVAAEKEARKMALVRDAQEELFDHIKHLNRELHSDRAGCLSPPAIGTFAPCIKGLKSLDSMADKLHAELLERKAEADACAQRLRENRSSLRREDGDWSFLFADFDRVGHRTAEDFAALAHMRISQYQQAEAARLERERQRIEAEARAKAERGAQAAMQAAASAAMEAERERIRAEEQAQARHEAAERQARAAAQAAAEAAQREALVQAQAKVIAAADLPAHAPTCKPQEDSGERLTLGQINAMLAPISISAAALAELGFAPAATDRAAKLYRQADFPAMCHAIARHVLAAAQPQAAEV